MQSKTTVIRAKYYDCLHLRILITLLSKARHTTTLFRLSWLLFTCHPVACTTAFWGRTIEDGLMYLINVMVR